VRNEKSPFKVENQNMNVIEQRKPVWWIGMVYGNYKYPAYYLVLQCFFWLVEKNPDFWIFFTPHQNFPRR